MWIRIALNAVNRNISRAWHQSDSSVGGSVDGMFKGELISAAMERTGGRSRGFDYMRILLAVAVVLWHSARINYPGFYMGPFLRPTAGLILPIFFALSGFLISGSLLRSRSIHEFVALRAIRIMPALAVETLISLVVIGSLYTTLPLSDFYSARETQAYLLNIVGLIHFTLPGVFQDVPYRGMVNASLWTVPYELECYLLVILLMLTRIVRFRTALLLAVSVLQIYLIAGALRSNVPLTTGLPVSGRILVVSFAWAVVLFAFRDLIRLSWAGFAISLIASCGLLYSGIGSYLVGIPVVYLTAFLGLLNPPKIPVIMNGDYSYGIYLYSFPIQQVIASSFPSHREWWFNFPIALALSSICAAFSWHVVEKPILATRKVLIGTLDRIVDMILRRKPRPDPAATAPMDIKARS